MVTPLFAGRASCGKGRDGIPRKSPTSSVPMFILLNIDMAPDIVIGYQTVRHVQKVVVVQHNTTQQGHLCYRL
jgi:hypothetical protein